MWKFPRSSPVNFFFLDRVDKWPRKRGGWVTTIAVFGSFSLGMKNVKVGDGGMERPEGKRGEADGIKVVKNRREKRWRRYGGE